MVRLQGVAPLSGDHLLAKEFDSASDVFAVEDEVVRHIVKALGVQPTESEHKQFGAARSTDSQEGLLIPSRITRASLATAAPGTRSTFRRMCFD
jgi:hypothetical protein